LVDGLFEVVYLEIKKNTEGGQQDGMICHCRAFQDIEVPLEDAYWNILNLFILTTKKLNKF